MNGFKVPGWDCSEGDHDWKYVSDWEGDPEVIGGTNSFYYRECIQCGIEEPCDISDFPSYDEEC